LGGLERERAHLHAQGRAAEEGFAPLNLSEGEGRQGQGFGALGVANFPPDLPHPAA
jgi:hypothetical protein